MSRTDTVTGPHTCSFPGRLVGPLILVVVAIGLEACATIPNKFVRQAEPGATLGALVSDPDAYRGKVVILGGVVVAQTQEAGRVWLLVKNRSLDHDYVPRLPASPDPAEAGAYWVMVPSAGLPKHYQQWTRLTVVGRVSDERPAGHERSTGKEPVLAALFLRGWGSDWGGYYPHEVTKAETQTPRQIPSAPMKGVKPQ